MEPGPSIVTVVAGDDGLAINIDGVEAVQELNVWPEFAVAEIEIDKPALYHAVPVGVVEPLPTGFTANVIENWF